MRLIDADELVRDLMEEIPLAENVPIFKDIIENQPTVYDIDKVVENLEEMKNIDGSMKTKLCIKFDEMTVNRAIEIVKQGLKEQNK